MQRGGKTLPCCFDVSFLPRPAGEEGIEALWRFDALQIGRFFGGEEMPGDRTGVCHIPDSFDVNTKFAVQRKSVNSNIVGVGKIELKAVEARQRRLPIFTVREFDQSR